jgi:eukaryotic-like serine/threonine-protein kinase
MTIRTVGHYQILRMLGAGGIGQVYAARDLELDRMVALKALRPELANDRSFLDRFRAEATSLARLSHPNITTLYTLHREGQEQFMVMELVSGRTIEDIILRAGCLTLSEALAIVAQMVAGLSYAHRTGIIHRDIKPANVMLLDDGLIKIMDFGIARVRGSQRMTRQGHIVGTLAYLPPEQVRGAEGDERSDLYSLAIMLYEMLSGVPPFASDSDYELARAHVEEQPPPLAGRVQGLPDDVERALMQALAKEPAERFPSVEAFARALGAPANPMAAADTLRSELLARIPARTVPADEDTGISGAATFGSGGSGSGGWDPPTQNVVTPATDEIMRPNLPGRVTMFVREPDRRPFIVLGGVCLAILIGFGVLFALPGPTPVPNPNPLLDTQKPEQEQAKGQTGGTKQANLVDLPKAPPANPTPSTPTPATPAPMPPTGLRPVDPKPSATTLNPMRWDLAGEILQVLDSNAILVKGVGPVNLYGITDPMQSQDQVRQAQQALKQSLSPYGYFVNCRTQPGQTYECFAQNQDVAELALKNGLARAKPDAPAKYHDAEQEAQSQRLGLWGRP